MQPSTLIVVPAEHFTDAAADWIAQRIRAIVAERGRCALAVAGGSTPRPVYERLAARAVPWPAVHIYFGDERRVPPDHADSNYRMVREALLDRVEAGSAHRLNGEASDADAAARAYEALLPAQLDLLVLGMGRDGHTASLFPGSPILAEEGRRRVVAVDGPVGTPARLTLTPLAIREARQRVVLVAGADKADTLARVVGASVEPRVWPVQLALDGVWIVDAAAAVGLPKPG